MPNANNNWPLSSILTATVPSVYPTEQGLSIGLQGGLAGDAIFSDRNATFISSFNRPSAARGPQDAFPPRGGGAGPSGGQNRQRTGG